MRIFVVVAALFFLFSFSLKAQRPGRSDAGVRIQASGRVRDARLSVNLPGVAVMMVRLPDSSRYWGFSDDRGYFEIGIKPGRYHVSLHMMGYADTAWDVTFSREKPEVFLGVVELRPAPIQLKEATVEASAYRESLEKVEVIITDDLRQGTVSARQLMEKLPGIEYDPFNDAIRVDNKENVLLLVNGMEKTAEYIKDLPPQRIRKIEIIRDPSGRYALEGYSAVINIILREDYLGTSVSVSTMMALNFFREYSPSLMPFHFRRLSGTHTRGKWSFYAHVSSWHPNGAQVSRQSLTTTEGKPLWAYVPPDTSPFNSFFRTAGYRSVVGVDFIPSEGNLGSVELTRRGQFRPQISEQNAWIVRPGDSAAYHLRSSSTAGTYGVTFFTRFKITPENQLTIRIRGRRTENTMNQEIIDGASRRMERSQSSVINPTPYIEWEHHFNPSWELLSGYAFNYREDFGNLYSTLIYDDSVLARQSYDFANTLARHQAYAYLTWRGEKVTVRVGSALERYRLITPGGSHVFTMPQPGADVLWRFHRILSLRIKYRSELRYPSMNQLADIRKSEGAGIFREGNPDLLPYNVHRASVQLGAMGGRARIEPYVKYTQNYIANKLEVRSDSVIIRPENVGVYWRKGVEFSLPIPMGRHLFMMASADVYSEKIEVNGQTHGVSDFTSFIMLTYRFRRRFSLGLMQMNHIARSVTADGYTMSSRRHSDLILVFARGMFLKERLSLSVSFVPYLPKIPGLDYRAVTYQETPTGIRTISTEIMPSRNAVSIRASFLFNKGKVRKRKEQERMESPFAPEPEEKGM